ncbi:MAG: hypothetical protein DRP30_04555 [Thermotoga sp.]|nr:MAG: hypothetical protein DRP30_04555 [Thermotoga sp.]
MVWFSKQKVLIMGIVVALAGAYLLGWFDILIALARGEPMPSTVSLPQSIGGLFLTGGTWLMKMSSKFAKSREV